MSHNETRAGCFSGFWGIGRRRSQTLSLQTNSAESGRPPKYLVALPPKSSAEPQCHYHSPFCDFAPSGKESEWWLETQHLPPYAPLDSSGIFRPEVLQTIENKLDELDPELRRLSLFIHELMFKERIAHDYLTKFMSEHGFKVTRQYLGLETAWRAEFKQGKGGRVLGINSEMDALQGIGHACGHNLIAMSGVGVAIAVKAALQTYGVPGSVVLLGTPGNILLLERGGYKNMDACLMCHPGPGPPHSTSAGSTTAMQAIDVEYFGRRLVSLYCAHAGAAPWDGNNALDAAFLAYSSISVLRQQMKPDHRVHGIVQGRNWAVNVFCRAAALATSCDLKIKTELPYFDLHQNPILGYANTVERRYGLLTSSAEMPALHPSYAIPTKPQGGNHTPAFADAAATQAAHDATMIVTKGLAHTGFRILDDTTFFQEMRQAFDDAKLEKPYT
ncbi:hypothetical protein BD779DRAFT_1610312 [Infundibulicybe gibba]|nr:hypothetical protein BD779DRAFT_1610312 [Infundibulicybe gibba]